MEKIKLDIEKIKLKKEKIVQTKKDQNVDGRQILWPTDMCVGTLTKHLGSAIGTCTKPF